MHTLLHTYWVGKPKSKDVSDKDCRQTISNWHSWVCLELWDKQLFGYLHEIFKWWLKTIVELRYLAMEYFSILYCQRICLGSQENPKFSEEIENWWLGTMLGQIWRLQCLLRPLEHPWGRGILLQKLATSPYLHFFRYQNKCSDLCEYLHNEYSFFPK